MRKLSLAFLLAGVLAPTIALSAARRPAPGALHVAAPARISDPVLLVVSARAGVQVSRDGGARWSTSVPTGLPRGTFYTIVADPKPSDKGTAYVTNGDVYQTADRGSTWRRLSVPSSSLVGPAGITALATDTRGALYGAGDRVLRYKGAGWQVWGQGWPADARPTALLALPGGLYAAAADHLYYATSATARWRSMAPPAWSGATITAMALGPDGKTPFVAVGGHGVWGTPTDAAPYRVGINGLPIGAAVYALQADPDPSSNDLYAATNRGLFLQRRSGSLATASWRLARPDLGAPIIALRPLADGGMLAVGQDGSLYEGAHGVGQSLSWTDSARHVPNAFLVDALTDAEWRNPARPLSLPAAFASSSCKGYGPSQSLLVDVCGPFRAFYLEYGGYGGYSGTATGLFGYPVAAAKAAPSGLVTQDFGKVRMEWTPRQGVRLAPMGMALAGRERFSHPTPSQKRDAFNLGLAYFPKPIDYFVDSHFYRFWRQYQDRYGASIFGPPISQAVKATRTDGFGGQVLVQYFQNVRMEYDPNNIAAPGGVQLSYLSGKGQ